MIEFKTNKGSETLKDEGFQVFDNDVISMVVSAFPTDLNQVAQYSKHEDVFRTKLGDIKQIQNLDFKVLVS